MIEHIVKEKLQSRFYDNILSETQKFVSQSNTEFELQVLGTEQKQRILLIEKELKITKEKLKGLNGKHPFRDDLDFSLGKKSAIDGFSYKSIDSEVLLEYMLKIEEIDGFLNVLKHEANTLCAQLVKDKSLLSTENNSIRGEEIATSYKKDYTEEFQGHDFYLTLGTYFSNELERIESLCEELKQIIQTSVQSLKNENHDLTKIKLHQAIAELEQMSSEIEKLNKGIFDGHVDTYYRQCFSTEIKQSLILPLSLYEYSKYLTSLMGAGLDKDQYERQGKVENLDLCTLNKEATREALIKCHGLFVGVLIEHCPAEVFVSLFFSEKFIRPVNWMADIRDLNHFIFKIKGSLQKPTPWKAANNCFYKSNGRPFGKDSIRKPKMSTQMIPNRKTIIDLATKEIKESCFAAKSAR